MKACSPDFINSSNKIRSSMDLSLKEKQGRARVEQSASSSSSLRRGGGFNEDGKKSLPALTHEIEAGKKELKAKEAMIANLTNKLEAEAMKVNRLQHKLDGREETTNAMNHELLLKRDERTKNLQEELDAYKQRSLREQSKCNSFENKLKKTQEQLQKTEKTSELNHARLNEMSKNLVESKENEREVTKKLAEMERSLKNSLNDNNRQRAKLLEDQEHLRAFEQLQKAHEALKAELEKSKKENENRNLRKEVHADTIAANTKKLEEERINAKARIEELERENLIYKSRLQSQKKLELESRNLEAELQKERNRRKEAKEEATRLEEQLSGKSKKMQDLQEDFRRYESQISALQKYNQELKIQNESLTGQKETVALNLEESTRELHNQELNLGLGTKDATHDVSELYRHIERLKELYTNATRENDYMKKRLDRYRDGMSTSDASGENSEEVCVDLPSAMKMMEQLKFDKAKYKRLTLETCKKYDEKKELYRKQVDAFEKEKNGVIKKLEEDLQARNESLESRKRELAEAREMIARGTIESKKRLSQKNSMETSPSKVTKVVVEETFLREDDDRGNNNSHLMGMGENTATGTGSDAEALSITTSEASCASEDAAKEAAAAELGKGKGGKGAPVPPPLPKGKGKGAPPPPPSNGGKGAPKGGSRADVPAFDGVKLRPFFWAPAQSYGENSIWSSLIPCECNEDELEELFKPKSDHSDVIKSKTDEIKSLSVLDCKKEQVLTIQLVKCPNPVDLIEIFRLGNHMELTPEQCQTLLKEGFLKEDMLAKLKQMQIQHPTRSLALPDQYFLVLSEFPEARDMLRVWFHIRTFSQEAAPIFSKLEGIGSASVALMKCDEFPKLFSKLLAVGNRLNAGSHRSHYRGFSIDTLTKFCEMKTTPGTCTLLEVALKQNGEVGFSREKIEKVHKAVLLGQSNLKELADQVAYLDRESQVVKSLVFGDSQAYNWEKCATLASEVITRTDITLRLLKDVRKAVQDVFTYFGVAIDKPTEEFFGLWDKFIRNLLDL